MRTMGISRFRPKAIIAIAAVGLIVLCVFNYSTLIGMPACVFGHWVSYSNETGVHVWVYRDGVPLCDLAPGQSKRIGTKTDKTASLLTAKQGDGTVIWQRTVTWEEFKLWGHVVISKDSQGATPATPSPG